MSKEMKPVDIQVSASLHPAVVEAIEGYDEDTESSVADVVAAYEATYDALSSIHEARKAASQDPTLNEAARIVVVAEFADKHYDRLLKKFSAAFDRLSTAIKSTEQQLSQPITGGAVGGYTAEIRAHVNGLAEAKRISFVHQAINRGDTQTASAVLGAPSYLSGLSPEQAGMLTRVYHEKMNPMIAKRLSVMKAAKELINGPTVHLLNKELYKAIGADGEKIANLRAARNKAAAAYTFKA